MNHEKNIIQPLERPHYAIIPYEVRIDKSLCPASKELFGEISGLSRKYGYVFAEDEQLAQMMEKPVRTIQRYLKKLEDSGHIKRRTKNVHWTCDDGKFRWKKKRKIYFKGNFPNDLDHTEPEIQKKIAEPPLLASPSEPPLLAVDITKRTDELKEQKEINKERPDGVTPAAPPPVAEATPLSSASPKSTEKIERPREKPKERTKTFSDELHLLAKDLLDAMKQVKPDYVMRKGGLNAFLGALDAITRLDGRKIPKIREVFLWTLKNAFWKDKLFKPNPAKYLRDKFDQLEMQMLGDGRPIKKFQVYKAKNGEYDDLF